MESHPRPINRCQHIRQDREKRAKISRARHQQGLRNAKLWDNSNKNNRAHFLNTPRSLSGARTNKVSWVSTHNFKVYKLKTRATIISKTISIIDDPITYRFHALAPSISWLVKLHVVRTTPQFWPHKVTCIWWVRILWGSSVSQQSVLHLKLNAN